ncbi:hypothetical protein CC2G_008263 [Coprinopsis cinerea AmutBmut pab1-1]|nr:hypothetical protein CC2G_008263 [Coprinopsis cinerea AmutBmut pab1-1]
MARLKPEVIEKARNGDLESLQKLRQSITEKNYVVSALEAALVHIETPLAVPNTAQPGFLDSFHRVGYALEVILSCVVYGGRSPAVKQSTVATVLGKLDQLFTSNLVFLDCMLDPPKNLPAVMLPGVAVRLACRLMYVILIAHKELAEAMFSCPTATQLALRLWSVSKNRNGDAYLDLPVIAGSPDPSTIIQLYVLIESGKAALIDALLCSRSHRRAFSTAFVSRVRQIGLYRDSNNGSNVFPIPGMENHWRMVKDVAVGLATHPTIYCSLSRLDFFKVWARALVTAIGDNTSPQVIDRTCDIIVAAEMCGGNKWAAVRDVVLEGFLCVALRSLLDIARTDDKGLVERATWIPQYLSKYAYYPSFTPLLHGQISSVVGVEGQQRRLERSPIAKELYAFIGAAHEANESRYEPRERHVVICDNSSAPHSCPNPTSLDPTKAGKTCGGCHWVNYCSAKCQQEDWTRRHRWECAEMRREYIADKLSGARYSYTMRYFQTQFIMASVLFYAQGQLDNFLVLDYSRGDLYHGAGRRYMPAETYQEYRLKSNCPAIEARVDGFVADVIASPSNTILLEAGFGRTHDSAISLVMKLERIEGGEGTQVKDHWRLCESVARVVNTFDGLFSPLY